MFFYTLFYSDVPFTIVGRFASIKGESPRKKAKKHKSRFFVFLFKVSCLEQSKVIKKCHALSETWRTRL